MTKTVLAYALLLATLVAVMKFFEYQFLARSLSVEFYLGLVAIFFTGLGVWAGYKLTRKKHAITNTDFTANSSELTRLEISKRELEVLQLIAEGLSNQEIADKLFVSPNTIKTHTSNIFIKLEVSRRTQAIQKARVLGLIP